MEAKEAGFSDKQIGKAIGVTEQDVRQKRIDANIKPWVKQVRKLSSCRFPPLFLINLLIFHCSAQPLFDKNFKQYIYEIICNFRARWLARNFLFMWTHTTVLPFAMYQNVIQMYA